MRCGRCRTRLFHIVVAVVAVACSQQDSTRGESQSAAMKAGVDSAANRLLAALRSDAPDSLLVLMPEDVIIMPPNEPALKGKAAVRAWYNEFVKQMRTSSLSITDREVFISGDNATEVAGFEWTLVPVAGGEPVTDRGSYMQLWHREPTGAWMFTREVYNSSIPLTR